MQVDDDSKQRKRKRIMKKEACSSRVTHAMKLETVGEKHHPGILLHRYLPWPRKVKVVRVVSAERVLVFHRFFDVVFPQPAS
jgi:hypothetical protein